MAAWFTLLALVLTWPIVTDLNGASLGSEDADGMKHLWTLWWIRHEVLVEHQLPFHTDTVNFPVGMDLYPIEPLNGLLVVILGFLPIVAAANIIALLNLTATGLAGALLGRELSGTGWGGFVTGTALQGSAMALFTIHVGVGELQHIWWLPLGLAAWLRLRRRVLWTDALLLGGSLAGATLSCFYHGFFLATAVSVVSLATLWAGRKTPALMARYALAAALGLLVVVPLTQVFATSYDSDHVAVEVPLLDYVFTDYGQPVTDPASARLDPTQLVVPSRSLRLEAPREIQGYGGGRYVGLLLLGLAIAGAARRPREGLALLATALVGVILAGGSYLVISGEELALAGDARVRLPFFYLNRLLGRIGEPINFPVRFLAITATALTASAALATQGSWGRWLGVGALLTVLDVQVNQLIPRPLPTLTPWDYEILEQLNDEPAPTVDLSLAWRADREVRWAVLSAQMVHGQKLQGVPLERIEYFARDGHEFVTALPLVQALAPAYGHQEPDLEGVSPRADLALLHDAGFRRIQVLGVGPDRRISPVMQASMIELMGEPLIYSEYVLVWSIDEPEATEEELEAWRAEHQQRIEDAATTRMGHQLR